MTQRGTDSCLATSLTCHIELLSSCYAGLPCLQRYPSKALRPAHTAAVSGHQILSPAGVRRVGEGNPRGLSTSTVPSDFTERIYTSLEEVGATNGG